MSNPRPGTTGATRVCPHCKTTILESAAICPACRHHLRFDEASIVAARNAQASVPLRVEGHVRHPVDTGPWEYTVIVTIHNERGDEINRQVVGVGGMQPGEQRSFVLNVEMVPRPTGRGARR